MAVTTEYRVTGMSCGHCEASVRGEVAKLDGIQSIAVSAADGTLRIESAGPVDDEAVVAAVDEAGYAAIRA